MHVVKYYALAPVDSAAEALESYELLSDSLPAISDSFPDQPYSSFYGNIMRQASAMSQENAAASLPTRLNGMAGNLFTANSAFFQLKIWCTTTSIPWSFVGDWALRMKDSSSNGFTGLYYMWAPYDMSALGWTAHAWLGGLFTHQGL